MFAAGAASAEELEQRPIGFSTLILRPEDKWALAEANEQTRIMMLDYLREQGVNAVGGEDLVFGKDAGKRAELLLGGTIYDLKCDRDEGDLTDCVMGVHWEVLDVRRDQVVYRAKVYGQFHDRLLRTERAVQLLLESAVDELVAKERFKALLEERAVNEQARSLFGAASFKACSAEPVDIETDGNWALRSVAVVRSGDGMGSGFMISDDPFMVTAAHVVTVPRPEVRFKNGHKSLATVIRIDREADVALLRVDEPAVDATCLRPIPSREVSPGSSVFVLGSPQGEGLAFSMSRGIVSGTRIRRGVGQLQTDASINLGNSGGPMVDAQARLLGVVSWKLAGHTVEGLGFAVSIQDGFERLAISSGEVSDSALLKAGAVAMNESKDDAFEEPAQPRPPLQVEEDGDDDEEAKLASSERYRRAPFTAPYALRLSPSIGLAYFRDGYQPPTQDWQPTASTEGIVALQVGFGLSTTFSFGLFLALETRFALVDPQFKCQSTYGLPLEYQSDRECVVPTFEAMGVVGYDLRLGSRLVLRPKAGAGLAYAVFRDNPFAAAMGGLDLPIRMGHTRLALTPFAGVTVPFRRTPGVDIWPISVRAGLSFDIGLGNLL